MIKNKPPRLVAVLRKGLERHRGKWPFIAQNANVSYSTICKLAQDAKRNPRVKEVQRIIDVLYLMDNDMRVTRQIIT